MIFVTVGSFQFDDLVRQVDESVGRGEIIGNVVIQIGNGEYIPAHCEYFRTLPGLESYYQRTDLVVGHGGTGTTLEVLEKGLRLISVRNPNVMDNHQHEFLEALERKGITLYCRDLANIPAVIRATMLNPPPPPVDVSLFFQRVVEDLETIHQAPKRSSSRLHWWLGRLNVL